MSVDLTSGIKVHNGIFKDGITYNESNYFVDNGIVWGCICNIKKCVRKCCAPNEKVLNTTCTQEEFQDFQVDFYQSTTLTDNVSLNDFHIIYSKECRENYARFNPDSPEDMFLQENGTLFVQNFDAIYSAEDYCIDVFDNVTFAFLCEFYEELLSEEQKAMLGLGE